MQVDFIGSNAFKIIFINCTDRCTIKGIPCADLSIPFEKVIFERVSLIFCCFLQFNCLLNF